MERRLIWLISSFSLGLVFSTAVWGDEVPQIPPNWRELPNEELMKFLPPEQRAVLEEADRLADEWLENLKREKATETMAALEKTRQSIAKKYAGQSIDIDEMAKKELAAQAKELIEAALITAKLPSTMHHGSTLVMFDHQGYCQDEYYPHRPLLEALCKADRPAGVPDGFPMAFDPMLVAHCTLPSGMQAEAVRQTCLKINGGAEPNNPLANFLKSEEAKRQQRVIQKREDFERRITDLENNPAMTGRLEGVGRIAPPATSIDALH